MKRRTALDVRLKNSSARDGGRKKMRPAEHVKLKRMPSVRDVDFYKRPRITLATLLS